MVKERGLGPWVAVAALLALPTLHPLLIPSIGVPSHLLWWVHVLPVALVTFRHGQRQGLAVLVVSALLVLWGERVFGAGCGLPGSSETTWALTIALAATNVLVAGFAIHARRVARRYDLLFDSAASAILWTDSRTGSSRPIPPPESSSPAGWRSFAGGDSTRSRGSPAYPRRRHWESRSAALTIGCPGDESSAHVVMAAVASEDPPGHQVLVVDRTTETLQERELAWCESSSAFTRERPETGPVVLDELVSRLIRIQQVADGTAAAVAASAGS